MRPYAEGKANQFLPAGKFYHNGFTGVLTKINLQAANNSHKEYRAGCNNFRCPGRCRAAMTGKPRGAGN